jgi:hypothetical protein
VGSNPATPTNFLRRHRGPGRRRPRASRTPRPERALIRSIRLPPLCPRRSRHFKYLDQCLSPPRLFEPGPGRDAAIVGRESGGCPAPPAEGSVIRIIDIMEPKMTPDLSSPNSGRRSSRPQRGAVSLVRVASGGAKRARTGHVSPPAPWSQAGADWARFAAGPVMRTSRNRIVAALARPPRYDRAPIAATPRRSPKASPRAA